MYAGATFSTRRTVPLTAATFAVWGLFMVAMVL